MTWLEQIKADREAGTPGPWYCSANNTDMDWDHYVYGPETGVDGDYKRHEDARRIARVPDMEAALLAAGELAGYMPEVLASLDSGGQDVSLSSDIRAVLAAFRSAIEPTP